jgi:hypothetical protein
MDAFFKEEGGGEASLPPKRPPRAIYLIAPPGMPLGFHTLSLREKETSREMGILDGIRFSSETQF